MKIGCVRCNKVFESLVVEPETAWKDIFLDLITHINKVHPKFHKRMHETAQKAQITLFSFLIILTSVRRIEEIKWLDERLEKMQDIIMKAMGFELLGNGEEEKEEEIKEEENNNKEEEEEIPIFEESD